MARFPQSFTRTFVYWLGRSRGKYHRNSYQTIFYMSLSVVMSGLIFLSYVVAPTALIWGWGRWLQRSRPKTVCSVLSFSGLVLATCSALLAAATIAYVGNTGGFRYYDPSLLRVFRWGILLALGGLCLGIAGMWRESPLRWHSPVCSLGMLGFWVLATSME